MIRRNHSRDVETRSNMRRGIGQITVTHYLKPDELKARTRLCAELQIPAGASIGTHEHTDEDEIYIIHQGKGMMTDSDQEFEVTPGDTIVTGQGASHSIRNHGSEDLVITAIIIKY